MKRTGSYWGFLSKDAVVAGFKIKILKRKESVKLKAGIIVSEVPLPRIPNGTANYTLRKHYLDHPLEALKAALLADLNPETNP